MNRRALVPLVAAGVVAFTAPSFAAPKPKPITKSWDMNIPLAGAGAAQDPTASQACAGEVDVPNSTHTEEFSIPAAGILKVEVTDYVGDWDFVIKDSKGKRLANSDNASSTPDKLAAPGSPIVEKGTYRAKKKMDIEIVVCNFLGGPQGKGKLTFTFA